MGAGEGAGSSQISLERVVEGRLRAPCCWTQTLDVHESELATSLRSEIRERLLRGELGSSIEDDLASRYGERIRAEPKGSVGRSTMPYLLGLGMAANIVLFAVLAVWWSRRRSRPASVTAFETPMAGDREYARRLDDELAGL